MKKIARKILKGACQAVFPVTEMLLERVYGKRAAQTMLYKPIFVIGPERSGTSLVYALLANHPDVYALSSPDDHFPNYPCSSTMARKILSRESDSAYYAVPQSTGAIAGGRFVPQEANRYWGRHLGSRNGGWIHSPDDYFADEDLDETTRQTLPLDLKKRLVIMHKKRLLLKQPGFSLKIRYLNAMFPDAIFVHCLRHPNDNFVSLKGRKSYYRNPNWGIRIPRDMMPADFSADARTAQQLAATYAIIQRDLRQIENYARRYVPVHYEAFQTAFAPEMQKLFRGCELAVSDALLQNQKLFVRQTKEQKPGAAATTDPQARQLLEKLAEQMGYSTSPDRVA